MGSENTGKEIHMLKIGKIHEGFVLDHIKAGKSLSIIRMVLWHTKNS